MYRFERVPDINTGKLLAREDKFKYSSEGLPFVELNKVETIAATPSIESLKKIKENIVKYKNYKRLHQLETFKKIKTESIALVGGGPSIEKTYKELKDFKNIISCGSAHDWLVTKGVIPTYATVCDPDPVSANYFTKPHKETTYLVATACDQKVFSALEGYNIIMWHCYSDDVLQEMRKIEDNFEAVGGGCTVGLRSLSIALMLGYSDIHFFGFDSCLGINDKHHAYDFTDESEALGDIYSIKTGMYENIDQAKEFRCAGYQLAQASNFLDFYKEHNYMFVPTFHGEGLLTEVMNKINTEDRKLKAA